MPIVTSAERESILESLSDGLRRLSTGQITSRRLEFTCGPLPPDLLSTSRQQIPAVWDSSKEPQVVPLWYSTGSIVAMRIWSRGDDQRDFVEIELEDPDDVVVLGYSEQATLAYTLFFLLENAGGADHLDVETSRELSALVAQVGFEHWDELLELQPDISSLADCSDRLLAWTRGLV